jgi:type IV pilus assembly protein PilV
MCLHQAWSLREILKFMNIKKQNGFTLIEAMITVVVFSFGLLGVAGIMTVAVKNNHNGYMRSQAALLSTSMLDMMRRNQIPLWSDGYNGTYAGTTDISADCIDETSSCNPAALVVRDVSQWSNMITQLLPNSSGTIACATTGPPISAVPVVIPDPLEPLEATDPGYPSLPLIACNNCTIEPFNGYCTISVSWTESNEISSSSVQTYTLIGKP